MTIDGHIAAWLVASGFLGYAIGATVQAFVDAWFRNGWDQGWPS